MIAAIRHPAVRTAAGPPERLRRVFEEPKAPPPKVDLKSSLELVALAECAVPPTGPLLLRAPRHEHEVSEVLRAVAAEAVAIEPPGAKNAVFLVGLPVPRLALLA